MITSESHSHQLARNAILSEWHDNTYMGVFGSRSRIIVVRDPHGQIQGISLAWQSFTGRLTNFMHGGSHEDLSSTWLTTDSDGKWRKAYKILGSHRGLGHSPFKHTLDQILDLAIDKCPGEKTLSNLKIAVNNVANRAFAEISLYSFKYPRRDEWVFIDPFRDNPALGF